MVVSKLVVSSFRAVMPNLGCPGHGWSVGLFFDRGFKHFLPFLGKISNWSTFVRWVGSTMNQFWFFVGREIC